MTRTFKDLKIHQLTFADVAKHIEKADTTDEEIKLGNIRKK